MPSQSQPSGRIDAHCHLWQLARGDYGWLTPDNADLSPIYRDFTPDDLYEAAQGSDAGRHVLVQAAPTLAETHYLLGLSGDDTRLAGVVGWVDLCASGCAATLEELAANPRFLGIRPMLQDLHDPEWINLAPRADALKAIAQAGLHFDALITPAQIDAFCRFAENNTALPIVIDHAAKPPLHLPAHDPLYAVWRKGMARLACLPHVSCKFSGLLTQLPAHALVTVEKAAEALQPIVDRLLDWFGPSRLMWGSDWPVLTLAAPFGFWSKVTGTLLAGLDASSRAAILGGSARNFYGLGEVRP